MRKLNSYLLIVLLLVLFTIGCRKSSQPAQSSPSPSSQNNQSETSLETSPADSENLGAKLSTVYADMMRNNKYIMKYKMTSKFEGQSMEIEATVAVAGDNSAITSIANGMKTTIISKDDKTYMIDHSQKTILEMPQGHAEEDAQNNEIETDGLTYMNSGVEDGLTFEKYSTTDGFLKYYFDGKKLVKIAFESQGQTMVMNIIEISNTVPDIMFELPANYEKTSLVS
ncbi:hypothetical protein Desor_5438 [Desulfosporosinus orientis DSM 765]|uniref:Outer membrane lipoprotein-sorting protein n=1 Tax=Desulfosporosinus orientis (strain ATCC 19365 / DSM 765 / NCIMB 8382 / VKM B-1628 / Singapore I) TaxID=768706 RepID=G7WEK0_DESOD|nr:hypothetical protein [Desulfosporosinus orientis]AET70813.1 hypothetical protein Desor_5438 [Desulfosporosinus orientis DSM 765]